MTYDQLISHYGSQTEAAAAIGTSRQVVYSWGQRGAVPLDKQLAYEMASGGVLKANVSAEMREVLARNGAAA